MKKYLKALLSAAAICVLTLTPGISTLAAENVLDLSCTPAGIIETGDGSYLVTDTYHKVVWKVRDGRGAIYAGTPGVTGLYGEPSGSYRDDTLDRALFGKPWAIVPFKGGYAVSDPVSNAVRLIYGNQVKTININIALSNPTGLAVDETGALYIADTNNNAIRKVTTAGSVTTYLTGLSEPTGLCYKNGSLYIADSGNNRILKTESGVISGIFGCSMSGYADGVIQEAAFANPMGVAVDDSGAVYVSDTGNSAIRKIQGNMVTTLMINEKTESENVPVSPTGLLVQEDGLYVCDTFSGMVFVIPTEQGVKP